MTSPLEIVRTWLGHVARMELTASDAAELLHPDYLQWELPNLLNRAGQRSDVADSLRRMAMARTIMASQHYEVTTLFEAGSRVVLEADWTGTMAIDAGPLRKGQELKAHFCMIFEFLDGKIHRIRNYDCFEPF